MMRRSPRSPASPPAAASAATAPRALLALSLVALLAATGCETQIDLCRKEFRCGAACCQANEVCGAEGLCHCLPRCDGTTCGNDDGCGSACQCQDGWACDTATGACHCVPESGEQFCRRNGTLCGSLTAADNCNVERTVACDFCPSPESCDPARGLCSCEPETTAALCARLGRVCGPADAQDNCWHLRTDSCGACAPDQSCTPGGACVCTAETDADLCHRLGRQCGPLQGAVDLCGARRVVADCGACTPLEVCDEDNGTCQPCTSETDAEFCARIHKDCGAVSGVDNCRRPRTVDNCGTCAGAEVCDDYNVCNLPGAPTNDRCFGALDLLFDPTGQARLQVDTTGATDNGDGSCAPASGAADVVYRIVLAGPKDLDLVAVPAAPGPSAAVPVLYLRGDCADPQTEVACAAPDASSGQTAHLVKERLGRGTWYLWIDGAQADAPGPMTLVATAHDPPPVPPNDLCASAEPLHLTPIAGTIGGASAGTLVTGTTLGASDEVTGSCLAMPGQDVAYALTLATDAAVYLRVEARASTPTYQPAIHMRTGCGASDTEVLCGPPSAAGVAIGFSPQLQHGDYVVFVDGAAGQRGDFTLEVQTSATSDNDTCANPRALAFDPTTRAARLIGDTSAARDDMSSSCDLHGSGRDVVYAFEVPGPANQRVRVALDGLPGSAMQATLSARTHCDQPASEFACARGPHAATAVLLLKSLRPGTYFLWVDGSYAATNGPFAMTLTMSDPPPPPPNDTCATARLLPFGATTHLATASGSTIDATNDSSGSCAAAMTGGDVVYRIDLPQAGSLRATVRRDPSTPAYMPAVVVRDGADCAGALGAASERACSADTVGVASAAAANLPQGTYYVIVDGGSETEGLFTLDVTWDEPITNDTCAAVAALQFDPLTETALVSSDTGGVADDVSSVCNSYSGKDLVYSFTIPAAAGTGKNVIIDAIPAAGSAFQPNLSVRTQCDFQSSEIACVNITASGTPAHLRLNRRPAGGTYYLWVDSSGPTYNGPFTLSVQLQTPPTPPAFDTCAGAQPLLFDAAGVARVSGSTDDATDGGAGGSGSCGTMNGPDVVYSFSVAAGGGPAMVAAQLTRDAASPAYHPALYLRSVCASAAAADEKACAVESGASGTAALLVAALPEGDYVLIVDGTAASSGGYALEVDRTPPIDNFSCAAAHALPLTATAKAATLVSDNTGAGDVTASTCNPTGVGRDLVWSVDIPAGGPRQDLTAVVTPLPGSAFKAVPSLRRACDETASELACSFAYTSSPVTLTARRLQAGATYYLWIEGNSGVANGPFRLEVSLADDPTAPPPNDLCATAAPLQPDPAGLALASGATDAASNDADGSCRGISGGDVVYSFELAQVKDVEITVTPAAGSALQPAVYVRSACDQPATEVTCNYSASYGAPVVLMLPRLAAGPYSLWVDSSAPTAAGAFALRLSVTDPPPAPANDSCRTGIAPLIAIDPTTHTGSVTGTTTYALDDYQGSCATASSAHSGGDLVYRFELTGPADVTAKLTRDMASSPGYHPAVYLRAACDNPQPSEEKGCANEALASGPGSGVATALARSLAAGTWYVVVDGINGTSGAFTLELTQATAMSNDTCSGALAVSFDASGKASVRGDTTNVSNDASSMGCPGQTGNDVVYSFSTMGLGVQQLTATLTYDQAYNWPAMYLRRACASVQLADEIACGRSQTNPLTLTTNLSEGVYYVWVDTAYATDKGPFTLALEIVSVGPPPLNDLCGGAESLMFTSGAAHATGSTRAATNDYTSSCGSMTGGDTVYEITLTQDARLTATVTRDVATPAYQPGVYLRSSCASNAAADQLACGTADAATGVAVMTAPAVAAGTYYVVVDGGGYTSGSFELTVTMGPALWHDGCAHPAPLSFDVTTGQASVSDDLTYATASGDGSCAPGSGPDLVYGFSLAQERTFQAEIIATGTGLRPAIYLRSSCATPSTELACGIAAGTSGTTASLAIPRLPAGDYYLWVDAAASGTSGGSSSGAGPFTLDVTVSAVPPPPANDTCSAPAALAFGTGVTTVTVTGDTTYAANDAAPTCDGGAGADVVYSLTTSAAQKLVATVTRAAGAPSGFSPVVYVRKTGCGQAGASDELTCARAAAASGGGGGAAIATINDLPQGTYWIWVDGASGGVDGAFSLQVDLSAPVAGAAANESCASPQALTFTSNVATETGTTAGAQDEASGSCSVAGGADLVYSFTLTQTRRVTAKVMAATGYAPAVYVRKACGSFAASDELACGATATTGGTATAVAAVAVAGDYWVWVDAGVAGSAGAFTLEVKQDAPFAPPTNDTCASPEALLGGVVRTSDTSQSANDYSANTHVCAASGPPATPGPDLVFSYTPLSTAPFTITVTPIGSWDVVIWSHTGRCAGPGTCQGVADNGASGVAETLTISGYVGVTYWIFVDGFYATSKGPFTIVVQ